MTKIIGTLFILSLLLVALPGVILAARVRVRSTGGAVGITYSSAKLSRPTHSVIVTFLHLDRVTKVTYTLSYTANGVEQGAMGSISPTGEISDSRDLYFGTCSRGVCTPHYNISAATLLIQSTLKSGGTNTKRYRIRI